MVVKMFVLWYMAFSKIQWISRAMFRISGLRNDMNKTTKELFIKNEKSTIDVLVS